MASLPRLALELAGRHRVRQRVGAEPRGGAFDVILDRLSGAAGRRLSMDEAVYRSEAETGHRNRAIGHLLRNVGALDGSVDDVVDLYFRQCSILVTAAD